MKRSIVKSIHLSKTMVLLLFTLMLIIPLSSHADTFDLQFFTSGFWSPITPFLPPPVNSVSGSIIYDSPSITAAPIDFVSISLMIDGYTFSLSDLHYPFPKNMGDVCFIGSYQEIVIPPFAGIAENTNSFLLDFYLPTTTPESQTFTESNIGFYYSLAGYNDYWSNGNPFSYGYLVITDLSHTEPTPIPATLLLFGSGLVGLVGIKRRKRS